MSEYEVPESHKWTVSPNESTRLRGPERIDDDDGDFPRFFAQWGWSTHEGGVTWVDYRMWRVAATEMDGTPLFCDESADFHKVKPLRDATLCEPFLSGFRKWDGCTQWRWPESMHEDHAHDLDVMFRALRKTLRVAADIMGDNWDGSEGDK